MRSVRKRFFWIGGLCLLLFIVLLILCRPTHIETVSPDKQWKAVIIVPSLIFQILSGESSDVQIVLENSASRQQYVIDRLPTGGLVGDDFSDPVQVIWSLNSKTLYFAYTEGMEWASIARYRIEGNGGLNPAVERKYLDWNLARSLVKDFRSGNRERVQDARKLLEEY